MSRDIRGRSAARRAAQRGVARKVSLQVNSEDRFRALVENSADTIVLLDAEGCILWASPSVTRAMDYSLEDEFLGHGAFEFIHPDDREKVMSAMSGLVAGDRNEIMDEFRVRRKDGSWRWIEATAKNLLRDPRVQAIVCNYRDVTDRKVAEAALRKSEEYFRSLIENASDIITVLEPRGGVRYISPSIERVAGVAPEEIESSTLFQLVHPDDIQGITSAIAQAVRSVGTTQSARFRVRHKNGEWRYLEGVGRALVDESGAPFGVINLRDVTDRVRAEEALLAEKEFIARTINSLPGVYYLFDVTGKFLLWNEALQTVTGYSTEEISTMHPLDFIAPEDRELVARRIQDVYARGQSTAEAGLRKKDGASVPYFFTGLRVTVGDTDCLCGLGIDISDRKRSEEALKRSSERLKALTGELEKRVQSRTAELRRTNEELESIAFSVSHDLRAQLRALRGFGEAVMEDYGDGMAPATRDFTTRVVETTRQMDELIQGILEYSRLGRADVDLEPLPVGRVAMDGVNLLSNELVACDADIEVAQTNHVVIGHYQTLVQSIANLVANAVKFVTVGTRPRVRIWSEPRRGAVRVFVADNGIGVPAEHRKRIFGMFERLHGVDDYPGTGIGLAIVHRAIERMGGRVGVKSNKVQGSCFWIELPTPSDPPDPVSIATKRGGNR